MGTPTKYQQYQQLLTYSSESNGKIGKLPQICWYCWYYWKISRVECGHNCFDLIYGFERENFGRITAQL